MTNDYWEQHEECDNEKEGKGSVSIDAPSGLASLQDMGEGKLAISVLGGKGNIYGVRTSDGSISFVCVYEIGELWYADLTVFVGRGEILFKSDPHIGGFLTEEQACIASGDRATRIVQEELGPERIEED